MQGAQYVWPQLELRDFWRWLMTLLGAASIAYGLLRKQIRLRDGSVVRKPLPKALVRAWFVLLGVSAMIMALSYKG